MSFSVDWFTPNIPRLEPIVATSIKSMLEIGCFEGRSTLWFLNHCPDVHVTVIDTFNGSEDIPAHLVLGLRQRFEENLKDYTDRLTVIQGDSFDFLPSLSRTYDLAYIDGAHDAKSVFLDGCLALPLTKHMLVFDDYGWRDAKQEYTVKRGVDLFHKRFSDQVYLCPSDNYIRAFFITQ